MTRPTLNCLAFWTLLPFIAFCGGLRGFVRYVAGRHGMDGP